MQKLICLLLPLIFLFTTCIGPEKSIGSKKTKLLVLHAGSLSRPFKEIATAFELENPNVKILLEGHGSRTCARLIIDTQKPADVMASADTEVINNLLIPDFAGFVIDFVTNEMVIMYGEKSKFAREITAENWYEVLLRPEVQYGHSDPNTDPCGYRSLLTWKLAEIYYKEPGLFQKLSKKMPDRNIRPKETDLVALLEVGELDYIFIYRSVAQQHRARFLQLPRQINLKSDDLNKFYQKATHKITGKKPGTWIEKKGAAMVYGITLLKNAPHKNLAIKFIKYVVGKKGLKILEANGQPKVTPLRVTNLSQLPEDLKKLVAGEEQAEL